MVNPPVTSYEDIPYDGKAFSYTHPDALATAARLCGLSPPPVERGRILELGCAQGGNLIPMGESLPDARCLGIDLSPRQISDGQEIVRAAGLTNVELQALSILDFDERFGQFDYIICHGVYSWVPRVVQDKILDICHRQLAPNGVAYISYNTYPGWHLRGLVRELLCYHTKQFDDPRVRIQHARAFLEVLVKVWSFRDAEASYGRVLRDEARELESAMDSYVFHEHLEDVNEPLYFHQFAERAAANGLQYLWETKVSAIAGSLPEEDRRLLDQLATDEIRREQYFDFLRNRSFRRTLLCHAGIPLRRPPDAEKVLDCHVTALAQPVSSTPDLDSATAETFRTPEGVTMTTNRPLVKQLLGTLHARWPVSVSFKELADLVETWRAGWPSDLATAEPIQDIHDLAAHLLQFFLSGIVELHVHVPRFTVTVSACPQASPVAIALARRGPRVTNLRHHDVLLSDLDRCVIRHLDGRHTAEDLVRQLLDDTARGELVLEAEGQRITAPDQARQWLPGSVASALNRLAGQALLLS